MVLLLTLAVAAPPALPPGRWFESSAGYGLRLPPGFAPDASLPTGPSGAAVPAPEGAPSRIDAAFSDLAAGGHSSFFVSIVRGALPAGSFVPERLAATLLDHLRDALGADPRLEWVDRVPAGGQDVTELAARFTLYGEERVAQMAFVPDGPRYFVVGASLPKARFADQGPQVEAALASFRLANPSPGGLSKAELGALAGGLLGLAVALLVRFRKRGIRLEP
ncbi:MAG TPA: hypothetical protein VMB50_02070 [Myxococcales bacterium]|nr:hypothetical protein [Myxococcales bacterium]